MDPVSAMLFALAVTWYGSKSGALRSLRAVRDGHRDRKASRPEPRPSPSGVRLGGAVSAGVTTTGLAVRDFGTGWRQGWQDGRQRAQAWRDDRHNMRDALHEGRRPGWRSWTDRLLDRMSPADRKTWAEAKTLGDIGERTARWLQGDITSQPGYAPGYGPADETTDLVPVLADANRRGFITAGSQPGMTGDRWQQRAGVDGFADPDTADRIEQAAKDAGLIVIRTRPGESPKPSQVVTEEDGQPFTAFGPLTERDLKVSYEGLDPAALDALRGADQVTVVDPEWGRNDRLWPALDRALDPDATTPAAPVSLVKDETETPEPPADDTPVPAPVITLVKETPAMPEIASLPELIMWLNGIQSEATAELEDAQARQKRAADLATQIDHVLANLQSLGLSNEDLNAVGDLLDPAGARKAAAQVDTDAADTMVGAAETAATFITARHAALQEAVNETSQPASMEFYENGKAAA